MNSSISSARGSLRTPRPTAHSPVRFLARAFEKAILHGVPQALCARIPRLRQGKNTRSAEPCLPGPVADGAFDAPKFAHAGHVCDLSGPARRRNFATGFESPDRSLDL